MKNKNNYFTRRNLFHIVIPLLLGFLIYVFFHKPNLALHFYLNKLTALPNYYHSIKGNAFYVFLINHLPDALWIYSLGIFLLISFDFIKNTYLKAAFIVIIGSSTEIVQVFSSKAFTFDFVDLLINIIILLLICFRYENKK